MIPKIIIAIDGFSSSGKSTMAKTLARTIGYRYIDSGAMYRAVTLYALRNGFFKGVKMDKDAIIASLPGIDIGFCLDEAGNSRTLLNGKDVEDEIRTMEVSDHVSPVAAVPAVRHHIVTMLQKMGQEKGIVMDGRDIGTTVFPHAEMKIFVNASPEERANRRFRELLAKGQSVTYDEVYHNIRERDHIDMTRSESPLRQAPDAILLDNGKMTLQEQENWLENRFHEITSKLKS